MRDAAKAGPKAAQKIAKRCAGVAGADVGSCEPLPGCLVDAATATGRALAAAIYAKPSACDDGFLDPGETCPLLEGAAGAPAIDGVATMDLETGVPASELSVDPNGSEVARTRLEIELAPGATIGQVNALLASLGASILMMHANVGQLVVAIPDPGDLAALAGIVATVAADPAVFTVTPGVMPEPDVVPANFDFTEDNGPDLSKIDHHLAVRAHAAWNARRASTPPEPLVVVADVFGDGLPGPDAALQQTLLGFFAERARPDGGHGYHVLGIIAGRFGSASRCPASPPTPLDVAAARGCVTGIVPKSVHLLPVDAKGGLTIPAVRHKTIQTLVQFSNDAHAILNTSLNDCSLGICGDPAAAAVEGRKWIELVRGAGLESRVLHLASAGNIKTATPTITDALTNSAFTAAALHGGITDFFGTPIPPLQNVRVIENARNIGFEPFAPHCLDPSSKRGGHLAGIGTDVWSLKDGVGGTAVCMANGTCVQDSDTTCTPGNDAPCQAGNLTGTSMATPQVAGLAAYLWSVDPTMTIAELKSALGETAVAIGNGGGTGPCDGTAPQPVIDAYAAILSLDQTGITPTPASAPVRHAILDVFDDGTFDELDLEASVIELVENYVDADNHGPPREPVLPDYGRFDFNGDGFTGGSARRAPFDLDRVGSTQYGESDLAIVTRTIEDESRLFDESALTDLEILCYYAYSNLYQGAPEARANLIDPVWCNPIALDVAFVGEMVPGEPETLTVEVRKLDAAGNGTPFPGARVELSVSGGSAGQTTGTTDANGRFTTMVQIDANVSILTIDVAIRPPAGGPVLTAASVSATNAANPPGAFLHGRTALAAAGVGFSYRERASGDDVQVWEEVSFDFFDVDVDPLSIFEREFSHARAGGAAGTTADTSASVTHYSELTIHPDGGFRGFEFRGAGDVSVTLANPGSEIDYRAGASVRNEFCVSFRVVGPPVSYTFTASRGPTDDRPGGGIRMRFFGDAEGDGADVVIVDPDVPAAGAINGSGLLPAGGYDFCVEAELRNLIWVNKNDGEPGTFDLDPQEVAVDATLRITP